MVVDNYPSWPRILRQVARPLCVFFVVAVIVTAIEKRSHPFKLIPIPDVTLSLLGAVLGILLAFRTNSAYARWWEARQLWGRLVNNSRSLARQAITFTHYVDEEQHSKAGRFARNLISSQIAYVHALRCALRNQEPWADIADRLGHDAAEALRKQKNVPAALLQSMGLSVSAAAGAGLITEWRWQRMDATLSELTDIQGGCERIKNTPLPRQYDYYPELFLQAYCLLVPTVLVQELGWLTPLATALVSFVLLVLNRIGKNLEDPFNNEVYDTPMTALSRTIEINLLQTLDEEQLPPVIQPVNGVLW
jgi:putative membrane protein